MCLSYDIATRKTLFKQITSFNYQRLDVFVNWAILACKNLILACLNYAIVFFYRPCMGFL